MHIFNGGWLLGDPEEVWQCHGEVPLAGFRVHAVALPLGRSVTFGKLLNNLCELFSIMDHGGSSIILQGCCKDYELVFQVISMNTNE